MAGVTDNLGAAFAKAMADKDHAALRSLLHEEIDFRAMTPGRVWEAAGPDDVVEQQAYLTERAGQIGWLRVMCSGYRPIAG